MLYKLKWQLIINSSEWTEPTYNVQIIWYDNNYKYLIVEGNEEDFLTDNPQAEKINTLPLWVKLLWENKIKWQLDYKKILKNKVRNRIEEEIWDIYDLLADIDKRLWMNERLLIRLANDILHNKDLSQNKILQWYKPFLEQYIYAVDNWLFIGRNDLEDLNEMFNKLANRTTSIAKIVKEEYLDKL